MLRLSRANKFKIIRVKFTFSKKGNLRYISHLDLMRVIMRSARRAQLPIFLSKGFNPHIKLTIKRALKLGVESNNEEASILLIRKVSGYLFKRNLNKALPQGIEIQKILGLEYV